MLKSRRIRCPQCSSLNIQRRGRRNEKSRLHCNECHRNFTESCPDISSQNRLIWFRQWSENGHTIEYISKRSGTFKRHNKTTGKR